MSATRARVATLGLALLVTACGRYVPAVFADRPAPSVIHDDRPIDVPALRTFDEREHISDIFLRRPLFDFVRPLDFPLGGDVNALDEVPTSSWYDPAQPLEPGSDTPAPTLPVIAIDDDPQTSEGALVVKDARGRRYELVADPREHRGLHTGAQILGGHLLRSLGMRVPRSWIVAFSDRALRGDNEKATERLERWLTDNIGAVDGMRRVSATLWPNGIDVGNAGDFTERSDDPNDDIPHRDRRTLRAMKIFAHWLDWGRFGVRSTRDVYVGKAGKGHLLHYLVGYSRALGTQELRPRPVVDESGGSVWWNFVTLGLSPPAVRSVDLSAFPSLGILSPDLTPGEFDVSPPYSPFVRLTPADEYWAGKRLMDVSGAGLREGLDKASYPLEAAIHLAGVLEQRRRALFQHAMTVVTPLDVVATVGRALWLRDRGIGAMVAEARTTTYEVSFLDVNGDHRVPPRVMRAAGEITAVTVPRAAGVGAIAMHVRALRDGVPAPRWCDVHVMVDRASARVIGVRH